MHRQQSIQATGVNKLAESGGFRFHIAVWLGVVKTSKQKVLGYQYALTICGDMPVCAVHPGSLGIGIASVNPLDTPN